jgi:hypothetical protein
MRTHIWYTQSESLKSATDIVYVNDTYN